MNGRIESARFSNDAGEEGQECFAIEMIAAKKRSFAVFSVRYLICLFLSLPRPLARLVVNDIIARTKRLDVDLNLLFHSISS